MSLELRLKRITQEQFNRAVEQGVGSLLDSGAESWATGGSWLQLDEFVLGFMRHQMPTHPVLYESVMGGTLFADSPDRDEMPRFFAPEDVKRLAVALGSIGDSELRARFDALKDIFGGMGIEGTDAQAFDYLLEHIRAVAHYFHEAAQNEEAVLLLLH